MRAQFTDPQNSPPNGYDTSRMSYMGTHTLGSWLEMLTGPGQGNVEGIAPSVRQVALDGRTVRVPFRVGKKRLWIVLEPVHGSGGLMLHSWTQTYTPRGGHTGILTSKLRKRRRV